MAEILTAIGLTPLWDIDINPGKPFASEIKELIARSHLFIPVLTPQSNTRPWVHQETGFAIALNIPVLPISIGQTPSEMISDIQAISVREDLSDLAERLNQIDLWALVVPKPSKPFGTIEVAEWPEQRRDYIIRYTNWVTELGDYGRVRYQARFSIFGAPDRDLRDPIWDMREGEAKRTEQMRYLLREERRTVERHARAAGCRLIIDPMSPTFQEQGTSARHARLIPLREFIVSMPADKLQVVLSPRAQDTNLLIIGDYFTAESMAGRSGGYVQTVFNSHPPTVLQRIQRYDQLFAEIQAQNPMTVDDVVERIDRILAEEA
jgi:hypothetical protein